MSLGGEKRKAAQKGENVKEKERKKQEIKIKIEVQR
jgi:hypothetical protein